MRAIAILGITLLGGALAAQNIQNATLRRAQKAYDDLDYRQALAAAQASLRERLVGNERARAYELLGFTYSAMDSILKAVDAFKQVVLLEPERTLDPTKVSPKATSAFTVALTQVLVVRRVRVDSSSFVGGQGAAPIRYDVTQPARVVTRIVGDNVSWLVDSGPREGVVNLRWPARLADGNPVPAGNYTVLVQADIGQNSFSASQPIRVAQGNVDTLAHLTDLPGYQPLPETVAAQRSWRPMGLAFLCTGVAAIGTIGLESSQLGTGSRRELGVIGFGALVTGLVATLKKPAPEPSPANILYNKLLKEQLDRRNTDIAQQNQQRRQQVQISVVPVPKDTR